MYCPDCKRDTNHADLGDHLYQCLHCNLAHPKDVKDVSGCATPKHQHQQQPPPYFDHQLAAAGEKRYESEA